MSLLRIKGGRVVDPANGVNDVVGDVWIEHGRVVAAPSDPAARPDRTIDARGYVVMPAGVDVHSHIAGAKVNAARMLRPDHRRDSNFDPPGSPRVLRRGTEGRVPSTVATGFQYAGLGYGTALDASIPPLGARQARLELDDTPIIDKAFLILLGNNHAVMDRVARGDRAALRDYVAWVTKATGAYGVKIVNPGGVERWKQGRGNVSTLDDDVDGFNVSPRAIIESLADAVDSLALPHPVHIHGLNLGLPGNAEVTLETFRALEGRRAHFAHIQFHSYGGTLDDVDSIASQVSLLADYINTHAGLSVDVGQVVFGETMSMTADGAVGQFLHRLTGRPWVSQDIEAETGCGIVPITYRDTNSIHALQWAVGLEWFLRVDDPWRVALGTDHPNGGSFLSYPQIIALLMDPPRRLEALRHLPEKVRARSGLADLARAYTLSEIAIITRAAPARMLGLDRKGHLGPGADGDVAIYSVDDDLERMFAFPRYLLKAGVVVLDDGEIRAEPPGATIAVNPEFDRDAIPAIAAEFERTTSIRYRNFVLHDV